jgi:hypothetical protein
VSAPFRVGCVVELTSQQWGTRERWPDGPVTGDRYVVARHDDLSSYIVDDKGQEWVVTAEPYSIWRATQVYDYPAVHTWALAVMDGKTLLGYEEWAKQGQAEALAFRPAVGQVVAP